LALIASLAACFPDGTWPVDNNHVKPGLYTSNIQLGGHCQLTLFQRNQFGAFPQAGTDEVGGRSFFEVPTIANAFVYSTGCGIWVTPQSKSYNPNRATAKYGAYRIPTDLLAGTYVAPGQQGCAWQTFKSFAPVPSSVDQSGSYQRGTQPRVTIKQTDVEFDTYPCGGWKRVGP
jgi:hypothetical protein